MPCVEAVLHGLRPSVCPVLRLCCMDQGQVCAGWGQAKWAAHTWPKRTVDAKLKLSYTLNLALARFRVYDSFGFASTVCFGQICGGPQAFRVGPVLRLCSMVVGSAQSSLAALLGTKVLRAQQLCRIHVHVYTCVLRAARPSSSPKVTPCALVCDSRSGAARSAPSTLWLC